MGMEFVINNNKGEWMKKIIICLTFILMTSPVFAQSSSTMRMPPSVVLNSDPTVAHWKMNDDAASTTLTDSSGNGYNATLDANSSTLTATGKIGKAIDFNATNKATIADADWQTFGTGTSDLPFSGCAWVDVVAGSATQRIMGKYEGGFEWYFSLTPEEKVTVWLRDYSASAYQYVTGNDVISDGTHHICFTYDGTGGTTAKNGLEIYVDAAIDDSVVRSNGGGTYVAMENNSDTFAIGNTNGGSHDFNSWIDDLRLFDVELSAEDITYLYNSGDGMEDAWSTSKANAIGTSASVTTTYDLNSEADLIVEGKVEVDGPAYFDGQLKPPSDTSDPCSSYVEGSIFYNSTNKNMCFCDGTNDLTVGGTACF